MIRFATIGTNFVVRWFVEAAEKCEDLEYAAAYSRNEETAKAFAQEFKAGGIYTSLEQLAQAEDIDAVYVASPNSLHFEQTALLLSHGKHVLCEKTITSNSQELKRLLELAKEHGTVLLEAMRSAYTPGFLTIKENLSKLGTVRRATFQYCQYSSRYDKFKAGIVENAFNPAFSNGALMDIGVYCVHPLVRLFGMPKQVTAQGILLENGVDGAGTILASYDGMQAELIYSKITNNRLPSQIQGEEGSMIIGEIPHPEDVTIYYRDGSKEVLCSGSGELDMIYEVREWARLIKEKDYSDVYNRYSVMELQMMDEARRQIGIHFPADAEEKWRKV